MYIHLGNDVEISTKNIIGIFDIENTTIGKNTKEFLDKSAKEGKVINVSLEMPRSFVVCSDSSGNNEKVYISQISAATLTHRFLVNCM